MGQVSDILIVGGGLNGCTLALALAGTGCRVTLIEARASQEQAAVDFDGRSYALALGSQRMLAALGLWDAVAGDAQAILDIRVSDGHAGQGGGAFGLHFDHSEIQEGPMGYMVEDRHLRRVLLARVAAEKAITCIEGRAVVAQEVDPRGIRVTLDDGAVLSGRLLVGSDGQQSGTARRAAVKHVGWSYGQTALVCAVDHVQPNHGIAHQFFMPEGPLAILPLKGNRSSIVWTNPTDLAEGINAMDDAGYVAALQPRFGDFLGDVTLAGARFTYPLGLSLAQQFVTDRVALIGDAAHRVHPIAGQGLNAGLKDVAALAQVLAEAARRGEDMGAGDVLARYQSWRRFDVMTLAVATDGFNRLFSNDNPFLRAARDIGMGVIQSTAGLRRGIIREAAGLTGDLPDLMQGRPL